MPVMLLSRPRPYGSAYRSSISQKWKMVASALTPSFQPIFLPSSYVRPW